MVSIRWHKKCIWAKYNLNVEVGDIIDYHDSFGHKKISQFYIVALSSKAWYFSRGEIEVKIFSIADKYEFNMFHNLDLFKPSKQLLRKNKLNQILQTQELSESMHNDEFTKSV